MTPFWLVLLTCISTAAYIISLKKPFFLYPAMIFHLFLPVSVWLNTGLPPFVNGYGSMVFFSLLISVKTLMLKREKLRQFHTAAVVLIMAGSLMMPFSQKTVPAVLDSVWLVIHVPLFFLGYLSLTSAYVASFFKDTRSFVRREMKRAVFFSWSGILTGAMWAEVSWGRFWGWDSKEVAALSIFLFSLSYFHFSGEKEKKLAVHVSFYAMLITYFAVSYLIPGNHNYI